MGLSRTGSAASNGSGDYVISFSTSADVRRRAPAPGASPAEASRRGTTELTNDATSALFQGVVEATEEAIYNSMLKAVTVTSHGRTIEALPIARVREILAKYNLITR